LSSGKIILAIAALAIILRIIFVWQFIDIRNIDQWEYGEIAKNITHNNGYSLFYFENNSLEYKYKEGIKPFSSAYMPPGYVLIILPFFFFDDVFITNLFIISLHIFFSALVIFFLYKLCVKLFDNLVALIAIIVYAVIPEFIYAVISVSPTIIFHLLIILIIYRLLLNQGKNKLDSIVPLLLSFLIYLRSEFVLFAVLLIVAFTLKKHFKIAFTTLLLITMFILPWSIRNIIEFSRIIPFTTNFGQNLYRGNNASDVGWWGEEIMIEKTKKLPRDYSFEIHYNEMYLERAVSYIKGNPLKFVENGFRKQFELWVFNLSDPRALNFLYLAPSIFILLFFSIGLIKTFDVSEYKFIYLFFLHGIVIATIFFALPRYQTMMKILMIPFTAAGLIFTYNCLIKRFSSNKHNN
jgi:4-amino-4-deoxy-L-arabinose transferase-like glycosyltransferase